MPRQEWKLFSCPGLQPVLTAPAFSCPRLSISIQNPCWIHSERFRRPCSGLYWPDDSQDKGKSFIVMISVTRYRCEIFQHRWSMIFVDTLLCRLFFSRSRFRWPRFLIRFPICGGIRQDTYSHFEFHIPKSQKTLIPRKGKEGFFQVERLYSVSDSR